MPQRLSVTVVPGDPVVVHVAGEIDIATAGRLRQALLAQTLIVNTVLDVQNVRFIDSQGVSVLVAAHDQAQVAGHLFVVRGATGKTRRVLETLGLDKVLRLEPS